MIEAIINGVNDPLTLSSLAKRSLKKKKDDLERALVGSVGPHQKMMLKTQLSHIDFMDQQIELLSEEVRLRMQPYEEDIELLDSIPGIGIDISNQFPSAPHLCSWAGMVPGNNESAGKKSPEKPEKVIKNYEQHLLKQHIQQPEQKTPILLPNTNVWQHELVKNAQQSRLDIPY
jgi:hypothetical protein